VARGHSSQVGRLRLGHRGVAHQLGGPLCKRDRGGMTHSRFRHPLNRGRDSHDHPNSEQRLRAGRPIPTRVRSSHVIELRWPPQRPVPVSTGHGTPSKCVVASSRLSRHSIRWLSRTCRRIRWLDDSVRPTRTSRGIDERRGFHGRRRTVAGECHLGSHRGTLQFSQAQ